MTREVVIMIGENGTGKGTLAEKLSEATDLPVVSSGALFRSNIAEGTDLGKIAQDFNDRGDLVPDDITLAMVQARIEEADCAKGFILDGVPRTLVQCYRIAEMLTRLNAKIVMVAHICVSEEIQRERLEKRALLEKRVDDDPEISKTRKEKYSQETAPVVQLYRQLGYVCTIHNNAQLAFATNDLIAAYFERSK